MEKSYTSSPVIKNIEIAENLIRAIKDVYGIKAKAVKIEGAFKFYRVISDEDGFTAFVSEDMLKGFMAGYVFAVKLPLDS